MRKRSVGRTPAVELGGVRTRARSAAVASVAAAAEAPAPKRPRKKQATARAVAETEAVAAVRGNGGGAAPAGCCYLQLRSRRLFIPADEVQCPVSVRPLPAAVVQRSAGPSGEEPVEEVAGISRCSSTASSVDVVVLPVAPARETGGAGDEAEEAPREDCDVESVVSDSAGCRRERRETTPTSRPPVDLSDEEWSQAADDDPKRHRRGMALATTTTAAVACGRARMPRAGEIEEFFGAAEKAQAERFAAKYNFDVARGLPLGAGRYDWTPVASR